MDSVHRYMGPIQSLLTDILADESLMKTMRDRAISIKKYEDEAEASEEIIKAIDYILDAYQTVGDLVSNIDRKHNTYTKKNSISDDRRSDHKRKACGTVKDIREHDR